jgi:hypothetical protein|tara:strand:- start:346 stop:537 length:192 start_codon:yes stop_codon:yes gene_type:complete
VEPRCFKTNTAKTVVKVARLVLYKAPRFKQDVWLVNPVKKKLARQDWVALIVPLVDIKMFETK